jgi:hypothetical protein
LLLFWGLYKKEKMFESSETDEEDAILDEQIKNDLVELKFDLDLPAFEPAALPDVSTPVPAPAIEPFSPVVPVDVKGYEWICYARNGNASEFVTHWLNMLEAKEWSIDESSAYLFSLMENFKNGDLDFAIDVILQLENDRVQFEKKSTLVKILIRCFAGQKKFFRNGEELSKEEIACVFELVKGRLSDTSLAEFYAKLNIAVEKEEATVLVRKLLKVKKNIDRTLLYAVKFRVVQFFDAAELLADALKAKLFGNIYQVLKHLKEECSQDEFERFSNYAISDMAEFGKGDDPSTAIDTIRKLEISPLNFPRVYYLQRKKVIRWCVSIDKAEDFEQYLCYGSINDAMLQRFLCRQLVKSKNFVSLSSFLQKYNLAEDEEFSKYVMVDESKNVLTEESASDVLPVYVVENIRIYIVNDLNTFNEMKLEWNQRLPKVIGLDTEQVPSSLKDFHPSKHTCQWIQIGFDNIGILIDLVQVENIPGIDLFLSNIFTDANILKIGMNFSGDRSLLCKDFPNFNAFNQAIVPYFELQGLLGTLPADAKQKGKKKVKVGGLTKLVSYFLKKSLDKTEQISDWGRRPLKESQIMYAALDAISCVEIYKSAQLAK